MQSSQSNEKFIHNLKHQIDYLHQYIYQLNKYVNHLNVYEYYIQNVKIDKVQGRMQIGQLLKNNSNENNGIHRFYIGEITIKEIEDSGTVGLGMTETGNTKKEETIITPDEANEEIKKIYEYITLQMNVENVPTFFQTLAMKKEVLEKVKNVMNDIDLCHEYTSFYEKILQILNKLPIMEKSHSSTPILDEDTYILLANNIEEQSKTLLVIVYLMQFFLPGYLKRYSQKNEMISTKEMNDLSNNSSKEIITVIKETFQFEEIPSFLNKLKDKPVVLRYLFNHFTQQLERNRGINQYFKDVCDLFLKKAKMLPENVKVKEMSFDEQAFLFTTLIDYLSRYPKYIFLEYLLLHT